MVDIDDNNNNEKICNTRLRLGIGTLDDDGDCDDHHHQKQKKISSSKRVTSLDLCFPNEERVRMEEEEGEEERQSITSNNLNNANGDHHHHHHEDDDNNNSNNGGGGGRSCARKKLRLTQEQSAVLEDSFKLHTTLNTAQKQALSKRLNLKPRQVEVWFQNRRARTKLKQTEVDCEFLKKYCENLRDENIRLKKEVQELRSSSSSSSSSLLLFQENLSKLQNSSTLLCPTCDQKMGNRSTTTSSEADADPDDNVVAVHKSKPRLPNRSGFNFFPNH